MDARPRNYLIYVSSLGPGGAERVAEVLASGMVRTGARVTLVTDTAETERSEFVSEEIVRVSLGEGKIGSILRLAQILRRDTPDVVLAVSASANLKLVLAGILSGNRVPLLLSYHGRSEITRGVLGHLAYRLAPWLARRAALTIAVSQNLARHLTNDWGAAPDRVAVIYNPVATGPLQPARTEAEILAREPIVLAVGRLVPEKDFATAITAIAQLDRPDIRLVILGEGPERPALLALAERLGVADRVELPGYDSPWKWYEKARCSVLTSRSEAFGNVVVEALAAGLPVVVTRCGGPEEIVDDPRYGTLIPTGDATALATAIAAFVDRPGDPGPRIARALDFRPDVIVDHYRALFEEIAGDADSGSRTGDAGSGRLNGAHGVRSRRVIEKPKQASTT
ncbi:MAG: glycosyltransferase [Bauldia sp.]|nr:glycosyltransferase [Bauldia sp.]